ncbi:PDDEXK nuclease domain-containing protein [Nocardioides sp. NPDC004968]|uniref:PDDEXK nuclease domain-containing protein n=1 Tax=Nocardioides sp. NPDC004968 TaxID=3155894 RepID=UPI0033B7CEC4
MTDDLSLPDGYAEWLGDLKERIRSARQRAALAVNTELLRLYWQIGREIADRQEAQGWGAKVIARISQDLRLAFPDMTGLSKRNLAYMRAFALAWPDPEFVQQPAAQIPWTHHQMLLDKFDEAQPRLAYAAAAVEHGWSRNVMSIHIEARTLERSGRGITNFERTLPPETSDLAREIVKDPYNFEFLGVGGEAMEREIEKALVDHVTEFLVELGVGFAYVGRQVLLEVGGEDFFIDLLFYHLKLRCYVVIELKAGKFRPEHLGQLNFYLAAVDGEMAHPEDAPTIGILLCQSRNQVVAEYSLRGSAQSLGVAEYQLRASLPSIERLQRELSGPE